MSPRSSHKVNKKVSFWVLLIIVILILGIIGFRSRTVNARVQSFFGDNRTAQKAEYQRQKKAAHAKYKKKNSQNEQAGSTTKKTANKKESTSSSSTTTSSTSKSKFKTDSKSGSYRYYVVKSGDTLSSIAANYGTTTTAIMNLNDLTTGTISSGTTLKLPAANSTTGTTSSYSASSDTTNNE